MDKWVVEHRSDQRLFTFAASDHNVILSNNYKKIIEFVRDANS